MNKRLSGMVMLFFFGMTLISVGCIHTDKLSKEQEILDKMEEMIEHGIRIGKKQIEKDPTSPVVPLVKNMEKQQEHIDKIRRGEEKFDPEEALKRTREILITLEEIKKGFDMVLEGDIAFKLGKHETSDLLENGQAILKDFVNKIADWQVREYRQEFPADPLLIVIKTVGYADEVAPDELSIKKLMTDITVPLPKDGSEIRNIFNKELSRRRAETINHYIRTKLTEKLGKRRDTVVSAPEIEGRGEEYPYPNAQPAYKKEDKRRRICKIYSNIRVMP